MYKKFNDYSEKICHQVEEDRRLPYFNKLGRNPQRAKDVRKAYRDIVNVNPMSLEPLGLGRAMSGIQMLMKNEDIKPEIKEEGYEAKPEVNDNKPIFEPEDEKPLIHTQPQTATPYGTPTYGPRYRLRERGNMTPRQLFQSPYNTRLHRTPAHRYDDMEYGSPGSSGNYASDADYSPSNDAY